MLIEEFHTDFKAFSSYSSKACRKERMIQKITDVSEISCSLLNNRDE